VGEVDLACETDGFAPGTDVTLAIRPEDVEVTGGGERGENGFQARVDALAFLGSSFRAELVSDAMAKARLRADLPVERWRRRGITEESTLAGRVERERIRVYPGGTLHT